MAGDAETRVPMMEDQSGVPKIIVITTPKTSTLRKSCLDYRWLIIAVLLSVCFCLVFGVLSYSAVMHHLGSVPSCNISGRESYRANTSDMADRRSQVCKPFFKRFSVRDIFSKYPRDDLADVSYIWPEYVYARRCLDEISYCGSGDDRCVAVEGGIKLKKFTILCSGSGNRTLILKEHTQCACRAPWRMSLHDTQHQMWPKNVNVDVHVKRSCHCYVCDIVYITLYFIFMTYYIYIV